MLFFRTVGIESNPNHRISGEHYRKQQIKNSDLRKNRKTIFSRKSTGAIIFVRRLNAVMSMRVAHLAPLLWLTPATDFCFYFQIYGIRLFNGAIRFVLKHVFFVLKKCLAWLVVKAIIVRQLQPVARTFAASHICSERRCLKIIFRTSALRWNT